LHGAWLGGPEDVGAAHVPDSGRGRGSRRAQQLRRHRCASASGGGRDHRRAACGEVLQTDGSIKLNAMKVPFLYRMLARLNVVAVLLLLLGAEVLLLPALLRPAPEPVQVVPEVARLHLTLRDGRLYRAGETRPYNGLMVEYYPDRVLQSRSTVSWGRLHRVSEGWHTNGMLQVREHFERGVSHGVRTKWDAQGRKLSEGTLVAGQFQGVF